MAEDEDMTLIVVDIEEILYAFIDEGTQHKPEYFEQPDRVVFEMRDGELFVVKQILN